MKGLPATPTHKHTQTHTRGNEEALHKQTKTSDERKTLHTSYFVIACAAEQESSHCRSLPIINFPKIWEIISSLLAFGHHTADSGFCNFSRLPQLIIATHTHTYTHTHIHTYTHTLSQTHTHIHTYTRAYTHTHTHTHIHTYTYTHTHTHTHTHIYTYTYTHTRNTHTYIHTSTHTHTYTHT